MINSLTSLRFVFAMMVFGTHCYVIDSFFNAHFFKEGFVGVSFFFVLSGFIIAYNYQQRIMDRSIDKRTFWLARVARVYPLHWLTLLIAAAWGKGVIASGGMDWLKHFTASLTLTNAYIPHTEYFFSFNSPSWSLCCEQLFYFSFPFLVPFAKSYKRLLWLLGGLMLLMLAGMYFTPEQKIQGYWYVQPLTRFPDFLVGMLLYHLYNHLKDKKITFRQATCLEVASVLVFLLFYLFAAEVPKVYRYSVYYWLPVAFVLGSFALQKGFLSRLLQNRYLVIGGEISYSFYLIHLFVLTLFAQWQKEYDWQLPWYLSIPVLWGIIVLLSLLSYYCFEKPMNKKVKSLFK